MGDMYCDGNGVVVNIIGAYEPKEGEESNYVLNIKQFNFTECQAYWGEHYDSFDILDLGGINKDGTTFSPDYGWRKMIAINQISESKAPKVLKSIQYATTRLESLKGEMGAIKGITSTNDNIVIDFDNGMNIQLHNDEIKHQAIMYLESEIDEIKN
jgi:hypothetical protein